MGDRVAVLNDGVIQQIGSPMDIYNHPENIFVAGFVGNPKMNLLNSTFEAGNMTSLNVEFTNVNIDISNQNKSKIEENATGRELVFGIRGEDVFVKREETLGFMQTEVYVIEPLGAYNIVDLRLGKNPNTGKDIILKAKTPPAFSPGIGEKVWMGFDYEKMHIFDRITEAAIS